MSKFSILGVIDEHNIVTGSVDRALTILRRRVGAYGREGRWYRIKIGYSHNYKKRWPQYKMNGWHALVPIYRTTSLENAYRMEEELINYVYENSVAYFESENIAAGRNGGVKRNATQYYVYLALARRYARLVR